MVPEDFSGRWIEPFMGTGVVGFALSPRHALLCDTNPHLIAFYQAVLAGTITSDSVRQYLQTEGEKLLAEGEVHYYRVRTRFNHHHDPLDFLFLNRAGFNGMIRFNRKGEWNIPFCKKPARFAPAYITKISNQVDRVAALFRERCFDFQCQGFLETIATASADDLLYCDPPYMGRHVDYYNRWTEEHERALYQQLVTYPGRFILSTWHHNAFRKNDAIEHFWKAFHVLTREHFYHVGGYEGNRNPMVEALVLNFTK